MLPFTSFTKDVITDSDLDGVTAQEGVSIGFNNFSLSGSAASGVVTLLGDSNGYSDLTYNYSTPGFTGFNDIAVSGNIVQISGNVVVDVATSGSATAVTFAFPVITLGSANIDTVVKLSSDARLNTGRQFGELQLVGFSTQVTANQIQIVAH